MSKAAQEIVADLRKADMSGEQVDAGHVADQIALAFVELEDKWRREKAEIEAAALTIGGIVDASRHKPGNAAAMREALELALDASISWLNGTIDRTSNRETIKAIRAALSVPARQCDVGTPAEQERRYKATGEVYHTLTLTNVLAWAQTPCEAQEGGAK